MKKYDFEERYINWWKFKYCNDGTGRGIFKFVTDVNYISNPSGFYGIVELKFEDGTNRLVGGGKTNTGKDAFKPRKCDVEVRQ